MEASLIGTGAVRRNRDCNWNRFVLSLICVVGQLLRPYFSSPA
jgi:hypothetical protein